MGEPERERGGREKESDSTLERRITRVRSRVSTVRKRSRDSDRAIAVQKKRKDTKRGDRCGDQ